MDRPERWEGWGYKADKVDALPLVRETDKQYSPGWCTYVYEHEGTPELEVLCGGINSKTPQAGAVWRQGNLLHFGFEPSPEQLNDNGRALLVNSIVYIARFTEDRPILQTPSPFAPDGKRIFDRDAIQRFLDNKDRRREVLKYKVAPAVYTGLQGEDRDGIAEWFQKVRPYIRANEDGKLAVDAEAREFGVSPSQPKFFEQAIAALQNPGEAAVTARRLLGRYAPSGPGRNASADEWRSWWNANRPYLFFSDSGGYRWYIDPLAKKREVPTENLRGPARATLSLDSVLRK